MQGTERETESFSVYLSYCRYCKTVGVDALDYEVWLKMDSKIYAMCRSVQASTFEGNHDRAIRRSVAD
jgi:hypothetical protein